MSSTVQGNTPQFELREIIPPPPKTTHHVLVLKNTIVHVEDHLHAQDTPLLRLILDGVPIQYLLLLALSCRPTPSSCADPGCASSPGRFCWATSAATRNHRHRRRNHRRNRRPVPRRIRPKSSVWSYWATGAWARAAWCKSLSLGGTATPAMTTMERAWPPTSTARASGRDGATGRIGRTNRTGIITAIATGGIANHRHRHRHQHHRAAGIR